MTANAARFLILLVFAGLTTPAMADDCTTALRASVQKPVTTLTSREDGHGNLIQTRVVQLPEVQYVQTTDGQWHSVATSIKERIDTATEDLKTAKVTCERSGTGTVHRTATVVYLMHEDNGGDITDSKVWIAANLIMRSDITLAGAHYTTLFDYAHVSAPANAKALASR